MLGSWEKMEVKNMMWGMVRVCKACLKMLSEIENLKLTSRGYQDNCNKESTTTLAK